MTTQLPSGFDTWLLDCAPTGCDVCAANWRQLLACKHDGMPQARRHATEIRDHTSGVHGRA